MKIFEDCQESFLQKDKWLHYFCFYRRNPWKDSFEKCGCYFGHQKNEVVPWHFKMSYKTIDLALILFIKKLIDWSEVRSFSLGLRGIILHSLFFENRLIQVVNYFFQLIQLTFILLELSSYWLLSDDTSIWYSSLNWMSRIRSFWSFFNAFLLFLGFKFKFLKRRKVFVLHL